MGKGSGSTRTSSASSSAVGSKVDNFLSSSATDAEYDAWRNKAQQELKSFADSHGGDSHTSSPTFRFNDSDNVISYQISSTEVYDKERKGGVLKYTISLSESRSPLYESPDFEKYKELRRSFSENKYATVQDAYNDAEKMRKAMNKMNINSVK